jgi:hypothetical protein
MCNTVHCLVYVCLTQAYTTFLSLGVWANDPIKLESSEEASLHHWIIDFWRINARRIIKEPTVPMVYRVNTANIINLLCA